VDFDMPIHDGLALAQWIRAEPTTAALPLVLLSSSDVPRGEVERLGFAAVLTKPVRAQDLRRALHGVFVKDEAAAQVAPRRAPEKLGLNVLLAEDNPVNRSVAVGALEHLGCRADVVENGQEVLERVASGAVYDVILMDCQMPLLSGFDATRLLRERGYTGRIVALTANALEGDEERCREVGMDAYLSKPFKLAGLRAVLEALEGPVA